MWKSSELTLRVLGDTRSADQVVRLKIGDTDVKDLAIDATFHHEWAHYVQYSCTALGVVLSMYRRNCFDSLVRAACLSPRELRRGGPNPAADGPIRDYWKRLEQFNSNWLTWGDGWHTVGDRVDRSISYVELKRDGIVVTLDGLDGVFNLPIGPKQIFEAWAWIIEWLERRKGPDSHLMTSDHPDSLTYTWPAWVLASKRGCQPRDLDYNEIISLLPLLFVSTFYDYKVLNFSGGHDVPSEWTTCIEAMASRNVTCGRVFWQLLRDVERGALRHDGGSDAFDTYLSSLGLPPLSTMIRATESLVAWLINRNEQAAQEMTESAERIDGVPQLMHVYAERDLLGTSSRNLAFVRSHIDVALVAPALLIYRIEPAVCAIETPSHYAWTSIHFNRSATDHDRQVMSTRAILRQQLAMFEHVILMYALGDHLGCYGSPEWAVPINECPHAMRCMALPNKLGVQFCIDKDWRVKVGSILLPVVAGSPIDLTDEDVPGILAVAAEFAESRTSPTHAPIDLSLLDF